MDELKPCPFCKAGFVERGSLLRHDSLACPADGFTIEDADDRDFWNTRAPDPAILALREAQQWRDSLLARFVGTIIGDDLLMMDHELAPLINEYASRKALEG